MAVEEGKQGRCVHIGRRSVQVHEIRMGRILRPPIHESWDGSRAAELNRESGNDAPLIWTVDEPTGSSLLCPSPAPDSLYSLHRRIHQYMENKWGTQDGRQANEHV